MQCAVDTDGHRDHGADGDDNDNHEISKAEVTDCVHRVVHQGLER